jgi:hypothetical protein
LDGGIDGGAMPRRAVDEHFPERLLTIRVTVQIPGQPRWSFFFQPRSIDYVIYAFVGEWQDEPSPPAEWPWECAVPPEEGARVVRKAQELKIPLTPAVGWCGRGEVGHWEIRLNNMTNEVTFSWLRDVPEAWTEVEALAKAVLGLAYRHCIGVAGPWGSW